jgi:hypothetical protein
MPERHFPAGFETGPSRARRLYRSQNAIWLWLGVATVLGAIAFFVDPATADESAVGRLLDGTIQTLYYVMLGIGGGVIFYGVWRVEPRSEIIGHLFVGTSVFITALAIITVAGVVVSGLTLLGVAIANAFRIYYLWSVAPRRGDDLPRLSDDPG